MLANASSITGKFLACAALNNNMFGSRVLMSSQEVTDVVSSSEPDEDEFSDRSRSKPEINVGQSFYS